ncbi:SCO family protein [Streptomyces fulvorobeus]|uniref:Protein SCO1/2 n=1 Tax=Streptomyces fulvorobeus TaxID=284028 RepID=A0A7J0C6Z8_9ACTN|nr:SCO family protein [Streptomyces fulvorobeus]NYE41897.1 protein SCO1/2 [Streptomyces fulvorobeus]GFM98270.1 SCO family protein [Streptomyces fulvorobeus]
MRTKKTTLAAALAAAAALTLSACGSETGPADKPVADVSTATSDKAATVLHQPFTKPDLVLTDTHGKKFDLRERTRGKPTLIYFGYTNCPDVCPLTMSNIALAKRALPKADQDELQVVFVTTDPERDTPSSLGSWLKAQDPTFVGLTGEFPAIQAGARQIGIGIDPPKVEKDGTVTSMHGAQVVAFSPRTDKGYVLYGEDTTADDYTKDLPKLITGATP